MVGYSGGAEPPIRAAVEVAACSDDALQEQLLVSAYRLSRSGTVVLMLNGVDRGAIDRVLDHVVAEEGIQVAGVIYLDAQADMPAAARAARSAGAVIASTGSLCDRLHAQGIVVTIASGPVSASTALSSLWASAPRPSSIRLNLS